jgi:hypothetical protein
MEPLILNLCARWRWVVNLKPRALYHEKEHRYTQQKTGWFPETVWVFWTSEKYFPLTGLEPWTIQPGDYATQAVLYQRVLKLNPNTTAGFTG